MVYTALITFTLLTFGLASACASIQWPETEILGLRVGMEKSAAHAHLREISEFVRQESKNQEIWQMNDTSRFSGVAVGYNKENKIRYVTAFVDKEQAKELIAFTKVGDLSNARSQIMEPHYRYVWDVRASEGKPASTVVAYGDNPEFVTMYTLVARHDEAEPVEGEEEEYD